MSAPKHVTARDTARFPQETSPDGHGGRLRVRVITCGECAKHATYAEPHGLLPDMALARMFIRMGWRVGSTPRKDRCPTCAVVTHRRRKDHPADTVGQLGAIGRPIEPEESEVTVNGIEPPKAPPPREATRADRRTICDHLDRTYAADFGRYVKDWSDAKVAEALDVPRAWVTEERVRAYGDDDRNEADTELAAKYAALAAEADALSNRALTLAAEAEQLKGRVEAALRKVKS